MCMGCVSSAEALMITGGGAIGAAKAGASHLLINLRIGRSAERKLAGYRESVAFLESLGHDSQVLLGPEPSNPAVREPGCQHSLTLAAT